MKLPEVKVNYSVVVPMVMIFVILTLVFPRSAHFPYDYKTGVPWRHETLNAEFDFPILKTEEQIQEEKSKNKVPAIPYYRYNQNTVNNSLAAAQKLDLGPYSSIRPQVISALDDIYSHGYIGENGLKIEKGIDRETAVVYIQKDKRASKVPASEVYDEELAKDRMIKMVSSKHPSMNVDSVLRAYNVYGLLSSNLEYDLRTSNLVNAESSERVSTTQGIVSAGEEIIKNGEVVTKENAQVLDSYKIEYENIKGYGGPRLRYWFGNALLAFVLSILFFLVIYFLNKRIFKDTRRFWYLVLVFLITVLVTVIVIKFTNDHMYLYLVPFTLTSLYLEAFFKNKMNLPICVVSYLPLLIFAPDGVALFVMFTVASVVAVFSFKYFNQGWQQFISALIVFVSLVITYFAFRLIGLVSGNPSRAVLFLFIGSMLNVAGYPLIYLFEKMFGLVSNSRLRELCDTNNPLLRQLEEKAPGTFQHSLQVMNMADAATRAIEGNSLLVRAGALYHDIGKMKNPTCFIENESLSGNSNHYHENLSPKESAIDIIRHVSDGLELAKEHNLPNLVTEFIRTHHGTSNTGYFYTKYLNEGGDPNDVDCFFYKGAKPRSKEQVILMLCDSVEAASRTLKDNTPETFSEFVENIVASKIRIGQLDDADISIKQLNTVKEVLKSYLSQLYHERVVYPNRNN
ncbi:MAG: HDIG domain-containing protein [Bacteroidales bacterium]|nr:HDIG domain-containing protein [Bacteroidales bacterium]